ncbi:hypothetical protein [Flagellimonas sp.]|uniref:hypothetical protein n=1 Tax=Flagellimonas sp. TaxID=2058762 RepID=UPI003F49F592
MVNEPIWFFGRSDVYNGLLRSMTNLKQIKKISEFLNEEKKSSRIILHMGDTRSSITRTIYEMLLLRFGGMVYNEVIFTSFLDLDFYLIDEFHVEDIGFIHLPVIEVLDTACRFEVTNYHKLLKDSRIKELFNHDILNKKYSRTILQKIEKNINYYERTTN